MSPKQIGTVSERTTARGIDGTRSKFKRGTASKAKSCISGMNDTKRLLHANTVARIIQLRWFFTTATQTRKKFQLRRRCMMSGVLSTF